MAKDREANAGKGGRKKLIIIIAVVVLLIIAGGGIFFFLQKGNSPEEEAANPGDKVPVPDITGREAVGPMVPVEEFVINIISADTPHYVKLSLTLELNSSETEEEIKQRMPQIRDAILLLIGNKTYEELQDLQGKKQLKAELTVRINSFIKTGRVKAIYFTNFVVQ